jgi:hypothetical protein
MFTLLAPPDIACLQEAESPTLAAGLPSILTLPDPCAIMAFP